jgi:hypothetical protein
VIFKSAEELGFKRGMMQFNVSGGADGGVLTVENGRVKQGRVFFCS